MFSGKGKYVPFGKRICYALAHYLVKRMLLPAADESPLLISFILENMRHWILLGKREVRFSVQFSLARTGPLLLSLLCPVHDELHKHTTHRPTLVGVASWPYGFAVPFAGPCTNLEARLSVCDRFILSLL